jgi:hypothetical protein
VGEDAQEVRVLALDDGDLLGGTLGHSQEVAAAEVGSEEGGDALALVLALAGLHQLDEVAQVRDRPPAAGLAPQHLAALLTHAEAGHPGHQAREEGPGSVTPTAIVAGAGGNLKDRAFLTVRVLVQAQGPSDPTPAALPAGEAVPR